MPLNSYFLQGSQGEQRLIQDLINEQLKIYGQDVIYLPRKMVNQDAILNEAIATQFDDSFRMEMYLANYEGFAGNGDILSKFGVQSTDQITLIVSKERYEDFVSPFLDGEEVIVSSRPQEGDLIYLPLDNTIFEIKYVEAKKPFYQLNKLFVYQLSCEVFDAALDELVDTGIEEVDQAVSDFIFTTKLTMVGLDAQQATASIQLAKDLGGGPTDFSVSSIDLINDGTGYTVPPIVGIQTAPGGGVNATAVAVMTQRTGQVGQSIDSIQITNPGVGYTQPPVVTIRPQNNDGTGAAATAIINEGVLGLPNITFAGVGYGVTPTVSISDPDLGATATATVSLLGSIAAASITNPGGGYISTPPVTVSAPGSRTGVINSVFVNNPGAGYTVGSYQLVPYLSAAENNPGSNALLNVSSVNNLGEIVDFSAVSVAYGGANYTATHLYSLVGIVTATTISAGLAGTAGLTPTTTISFGNHDDGYFEVPIPFNINYHGLIVNKVYVGTNNYLTFGGGSTQRNNFSTSAPLFNKIMIQSGENSVERIYYGTTGSSPNRIFRVRSEGSVGTAHSNPPNMIYEASFYEATPNQIDIQTGTLARTDGFSGAYSRKALLAMGNLASPNSGTRLTSSVGGNGDGRIDINTVTTGGGVTATMTAAINAGNVTSLTITNPGSGYTSPPTVAISNDQQYMDPNNARASAVVIVDADEKVSSIRYINAGIGYTQTPNVTIEAPASGISTDNYLSGELVRGVSTGTTAYVHHWDADTNVLQITNASSNFALGELIVGIGTSNLGSNAARKIESISDQDEYDEFADNIEIESEADNILDFTEKNPFGEF